LKDLKPLRIFLAGHEGMVGQSIFRSLQTHENLEIIIAKKSNLFKNIYIVTNDKESANILVKKYSFLKFIIVKNTQEPFNLMIKRINQKMSNLTSSICVLLPNYPFKSVTTIKKIFLEYKKRKTNLIISVTALNNFFYDNRSSFINLTLESSILACRLFLDQSFTSPSNKYLAINPVSPIPSKI
jgi:CMP-N-acetylneuraminic acid synthetase